MKRHQKLLGFILVFLLTLLLGGPSIDASSSLHKMYVHYIDVGESDCVLIKSNTKYMLIDAGDVRDEKTIINYLNKKKVKKLDYVICTHPHADHIGAMPKVIKTYTIGKIIMPSKIHTTDTFEELLKAISNKGLKITKPVVGKNYKIGNASFKIIAPNANNYGDNINNYSVGIKLTNGKNSFVFIGDCEKEAISDILANKINLKSDVLMCGHHGSDTSTTSALLKEVSPKHAVISVGKNSYGHPSNSVLKLLKQSSIHAYRTDEHGTITATSTGSTVTFDVKESTIKESDIKSGNSKADVLKNSSTIGTTDTVVYITKTGTKYHRASCSYLKKSKIKITLKKAKQQGLTRCGKCNPPK